MVYDPDEAMNALVRYYNTISGKKTGRKQVGPLWEALAMVKAGFGVTAEPFLQVKSNEACAFSVRLAGCFSVATPPDRSRRRTNHERS